VQVHPIKLKLKPPGSVRLKLKCDVLLSASAFNSNLRHHIEEMQTVFSLESFGGDGGDVDGDGAAIRQYTLHPNPKP